MRKLTGIYLVLGIGFLFVPLLKHLFWESAFVITLIHSFYILIRTGKSPLRFSGVDLSIIGAGIPLFLSDLILGCFSVDGLAFWVFIPFPAFLLIRSIQSVIFRFQIRTKWVSFIVFILLAIGLPVLELKHSSVVRLFNPIWGYWPGPIYDEAIRFPAVLIIYRVSTFLWSLLLFEMSEQSVNMKRIGLYFVAIVFLFLSFRPLGIVKTNESIEQLFSGKMESDSIILHYDSTQTSSVEALYWLNSARFFTQELSDELHTSLAEPIHFYLYNHAWQKQNVTGAKFTQFTPVWSSGFQIHVDKQSAESVLKHELAHAVAKSLTNSFLGASWNIGLTEGLATALDPFVSDRFTIHELSAAASDEEKAELIDLLSFSGFYKSHSSKAYTLSGSFIRFLLDSKPIHSMHNWYAGESFEKAYSTTLENSIQDWKSFLSTIPIDSSTVKESRQRFRKLSLFEKKCPRKRTNDYWSYDKISQFRVEQNTIAFKNQLIVALSQSRDSAWTSYFNELISVELIKEQKLDSAYQRLKQHPETNSLLIQSDIYCLRDQERTDSDSLISKAVIQSLFRSDKKTHQQFVQLYYYQKLPANPDSIAHHLIPLALQIVMDANLLYYSNYFDPVFSFISIPDQLKWIQFLEKTGQLNHAKTLLDTINLTQAKTVQIEYIKHRKRLNSFLLNFD